MTFAIWTLTSKQSIAAVGQEDTGDLRIANIRLDPNYKVEPLEKIRPATAYMLTIDDVREFPKYEKTWKEIFSDPLKFGSGLPADRPRQRVGKFFQRAGEPQAQRARNSS